MTEIKKAVVSGILISIGGCVLIASTKSGMMWAGAVLFSLGLFAICEYGFNLYTGKVGYIAEHFRDTPEWIRSFRVNRRSAYCGLLYQT